MPDFFGRERGTGMKRLLLFLSCLQILFLVLLGRAGVPSQAQRTLGEMQHFPSGTRITVSGDVTEREEFEQSVRITLKECVCHSRGRRPRGRLLRGKILVQLAKDSAVFPGDRCTVSGVRRDFQKAGNPGQFDVFRWRTSDGYLFELKDAAVKRTERFHHVTYAGYCIRSKLQSILESILPSQEDAAAASAVFLGRRSALPDELKTMYQRAGISHILAISGLHIGILAMGTWRVLRKRGAGFGLCTCCSMAVLTGFLFLTGLSVSSLRACVMFAVWCGAQAAGRGHDPLTGLALAGSAAGCLNPSCLTGSAFMLSFGCLLSLLCLMPVIREAVPKPAAVLAPGISIFLGTAPIIAGTYYQLSPWSMIINLLVIPLMPFLFLSGMAGMAAGFFYTGAGCFLAAPCHYILVLIRFLCGLHSRLPVSGIITGAPSAGQITAYYGILAGTCVLILRHSSEAYRNKRRGRRGKKHKYSKKAVRRRNVVLLTAGSLAALLALSFHARPALRLSFLDVGQGDCALIESGSFTALIDCGSSTVDQIWERRVRQTLLYRGISQLDAVFLTHGDMDHVNGIQEYLEEAETDPVAISSLVLSGVAGQDEILAHLMQACEEKGIGSRILCPGDECRYGQLSLKCLFPDEDFSSAERNESSLVLELKYGAFSCLYTGDLEGEGEERLLTQVQADAPVSLLKVAHHGSGHSTSEAFLKRFRPEVGIVSCGEGNVYHHPHQVLLERLKECGCAVRRTDREGAITVSVGKNGFRIDSFAG